MRKEVADLWVKALRSGKYKQGTRKLQTPAGHCCLGVLCAIAPQKHFDSDGLIAGRSLLSQRAVKEWAGVAEAYGEIILPKGQVSLASLNDHRGRSFKHIAAFIERNWEKL